MWLCLFCSNVLKQRYICLSVCLSIYLSTYLPTYLPIYLFIYVSIYLLLYSPCDPWPHFQFLDLYRVGRTPWTGDQPVARPLPTHRTTQTQNKGTQTYMHRVGFEPTIPVFERAKTARPLGSAHTSITNINLLVRN
jgi:hypothetical protein